MGSGKFSSLVDCVDHVVTSKTTQKRRSVANVSKDIQSGHADQQKVAMDDYDHAVVVIGFLIPDWQVALPRVLQHVAAATPRLG